MQFNRKELKKSGYVQGFYKGVYFSITRYNNRMCPYAFSGPAGECMYDQLEYGIEQYSEMITGFLEAMSMP